ncbi:SMI1 / KNR4 family protein [Bacillus sonorensis]|nr:SMI1 / KNR4 family protein [Bacillus sonorensis]
MTPANEKNIELVKEWISKNIKKNLWIKEYGDFLRKADGLEFNGLIIYNANPNDVNNGIIGANEIWHENEWNNRYLFLGDSDISWYCFDIDYNVFVELDKPSGDVVEEFTSFNKMIEEAINSVI